MLCNTGTEVQSCPPNPCCADDGRPSWAHLLQPYQLAAPPSGRSIQRHRRFCKVCGNTFSRRWASLPALAARIAARRSKGLDQAALHAQLHSCGRKCRRQHALAQGQASRAHGLKGQVQPRHQLAAAAAGRQRGADLAQTPHQAKRRHHARLQRGGRARGGVRGNMREQATTPAGSFSQQTGRQVRAQLCTRPAFTSCCVGQPQPSTSRLHNKPLPHTLSCRLPRSCRTA